MVLWHPVGVESPTAVGGFTGAGLLAGGCGIMWELIPTAVGGSCGSCCPQQQLVDSQVLDC